MNDKSKLWIALIAFFILAVTFLMSFYYAEFNEEDGQPANFKSWLLMRIHLLSLFSGILILGYLYEKTCEKALI